MNDDQSKTMEVANSTSVNDGIQIHQSKINATNGAAATLNGHAAVQRGLDILAETDLDNNSEEIKKLDTQIDHFNSYLDKFEARNEELNKKLNLLLTSQKEERVKRLASFQQKELENRAESDALEGQMRALLNRCHQARVRPLLEHADDAHLQHDDAYNQDVIDKH